MLRRSFIVNHRIALPPINRCPRSQAPITSPSFAPVAVGWRPRRTASEFHATDSGPLAARLQQEQARTSTPCFVRIANNLSKPPDLFHSRWPVAQISHRRRHGVHESRPGRTWTKPQKAAQCRLRNTFSGALRLLRRLKPERNDVDLGRTRAGGLGTCTFHSGK
jgi:hypothetical protein